MPPPEFVRLAFDRNRILRKDSGGVKQGAMKFAAVETMAKPDPEWLAGGDEPHIAAQAAAAHSVCAVIVSRQGLPARNLVMSSSQTGPARSHQALWAFAALDFNAAMIGVGGSRSMLTPFWRMRR